MKKTILSILLASFLLIGFSSNAYALISVRAGIPISYASSELDDDLTKDGSPSGYLLHVSLPFLMGLGVESMEQKYTLTSNGVDSEYKLTLSMYDIFFDLPIPIIRITVGAGFGTSKLDLSASGVDVEYTGNATQFYLEFGLPIALFDIHLSYHTVSSTASTSTSGLDDVNVGGNMIAVGVGIGF